MTHPALKWVAANLGLPIATAVLTGIVSGIYMVCEVGAEDYAHQRNALSFADAGYRHLVAEALQDGKITRWENTGLYGEFWQHASSLASLKTSPGSLASERQALAKAANVILPAD